MMTPVPDHTGLRTAGILPWFPPRQAEIPRLMQSKTDRSAVARRSPIVGIGLGGVVAACLPVIVYTFLG